MRGCNASGASGRTEPLGDIMAISIPRLSALGIAVSASLAPVSAFAQLEATYRCDVDMEQTQAVLERHGLAF